MADYFTNFSLCLPLNGQQRDYALALVKQALAHRNEDEPLPDTFPSELKNEIEDWCFEAEAEGDELWLH